MTFLGAFKSNNAGNDDLQQSMTGVAVGSMNKSTVVDVAEDENVGAGDVVLGIIFAVLTGLFGGSIGFPSNWTSDEDNNSRLKFLISFAVGCCCIFPITGGWILFVAKDKIEWHLNTCLIPGLFAGLIWNCANVASLYAIQSLGYGVAYPIMQSSLIVANLWGIFVWKEITDKTIICLLFGFCFIVMGGCGLITIGVIGI